MSNFERIAGLIGQRTHARFAGSERAIWEGVGGDELPLPLAFTLFDAALSIGPTRAMDLLQRVVGPVTDMRLFDLVRVHAAQSGVLPLCRDYCAERLLRLVAGLDGEDVERTVRRIATVLTMATELSLTREEA